MVWLAAGRNPATNRFVFSAVRIATSIRINTNVEGKLSDTGDQGEPVVLCPMQIKLSWNNSIGFVRQESDPACSDTTPARHVTISDMGVITAKPDDPNSSNATSTAISAHPCAGTCAAADRTLLGDPLGVGALAPR